MRSGGATPTGNVLSGPYPQAMDDTSWNRTLETLAAGTPVPVVQWPPSRIRLVRGLSGDVVDDDDLPLRFAPTTPQTAAR